MVKTWHGWHGDISRRPICMIDHLVGKGQPVTVLGGVPQSYG
jgi:hypothetical protein